MANAKKYDIDSFGLSNSIRKRIESLINLQLNPSTINLFTIEFSGLDDETRSNIGRYISRLLEIETLIIQEHYDYLKANGFTLGSAKQNIIIQQRKTNLHRIQTIFEPKTNTGRKLSEVKKPNTDFKGLDFKKAMLIGNTETPADKEKRHLKEKATKKRLEEIEIFEKEQKEKLMKKLQGSMELDSNKVLKNMNDRKMDAANKITSKIKGFYSKFDQQNNFIKSEFLTDDNKTADISENEITLSKGIENKKTTSMDLLMEEVNKLNTDILKSTNMVTQVEESKDKKEELKKQLYLENDEYENELQEILSKNYENDEFKVLEEQKVEEDNSKLVKLIEKDEDIVNLKDTFIEKIKEIKEPIKNNELIEKELVSIDEPDDNIKSSKNNHLFDKLQEILKNQIIGILEEKEFVEQKVIELELEKSRLFVDKTIELNEVKEELKSQELKNIKEKLALEEEILNNERLKIQKERELLRGQQLKIEAEKKLLEKIISEKNEKIFIKEKISPVEEKTKKIKKIEIKNEEIEQVKPATIDLKKLDKVNAEKMLKNILANVDKSISITELAKKQKEESDKLLDLETKKMFKVISDDELKILKALKNKKYNLLSKEFINQE